MNARLWASTAGGSDDHYITQRNPDNSTHDFVDYDANLTHLRTACPRQAAKVLKRIDGTGPRARRGARLPRPGARDLPSLSVA